MILAGLQEIKNCTFDIQTRNFFVESQNELSLDFFKKHIDKLSKDAGYDYKIKEFKKI